MNNPIWLNKILRFTDYYRDQLPIIRRKYPQTIKQTKIFPSGLLFEVSNLTEAGRVRYLDDEEEILRYLISRIGPDDIFYDIGSCIGIYSLHISRKCQFVVAFEPEPNFRSHLERNIVLNGTNNIQVSSFAISNENGSIELYTNGLDGKSPSLEDSQFLSSITVETKTLDSIIQLQGYKLPTVIKMDIEGAEYKALQGMRQLLENNPPRLIFLEVHPELLENQNIRAKDITAMLENFGYQTIIDKVRDKQIHCIYEHSA